MGEPKADLAYCERSTATPTSPVHIRRVGPEGRRLGGRAPNTVLCGADLRSGWDLRSDVPSTLARWRLVPQDQPGRVCITCADLAASLILATEAAASAQGTTVTAVLREALARYVRRHEKTKAPTTRQET